MTKPMPTLSDRFQWFDCGPVFRELMTESLRGRPVEHSILHAVKWKDTAPNDGHRGRGQRKEKGRRKIEREESWGIS